MRISAFNNDPYEEQRRVLQRKEANDAYKKNAIYTQAKKNPMLKILEDLLSGKTEKELFEKEPPLTNEESGNPEPNTLLLEENEDHDRLIQAPKEELPFEMVVQSTDEMASDEEETNRISHAQFDFFTQELSIHKTTDSRNHPIYKKVESAVFEKNYLQAISSYSYHMQMAQNGFKLEQPVFSYIA